MRGRAAPDPVRLALRAGEPSRVRRSHRPGRAHQAAGGQPRSEARRRYFSGQPEQVVRARPRRSEPRAMVGGAEVRRSCHGNSNRQGASHLHAIGVGSRRHPVFRSHAQAHDFHLRVQAEAGRARAGVQRRRSDRLRHPPLRHQRQFRSAARVDRRQRAHVSGVQARADLDADAQPGRAAGDSLGRQQEIRLPDGPARQRPERRRDQSAGAAARKHDSRSRLHLRRPAARRAPGARGGRAAGAGSRNAERVLRHSDRAQLHLHRTLGLVSAGTGHRLRHRQPRVESA